MHFQTILPLVASGPPACDGHLLSSARLTPFVMMASHHAVGLLALCVNYLKIPLRLVLPPAGLPEIDLHVSYVESHSRGLWILASLPTPGLLREVRGEEEERLRKEAVGNHFNHEASRPTRLSP